MREIEYEPKPQTSLSSENPNPTSSSESESDLDDPPTNIEISRREDTYISRHSRMGNVEVIQEELTNEDNDEMNSEDPND